MAEPNQTPRPAPLVRVIGPVTVTQWSRVCVPVVVLDPAGGDKVDVDLRPERGQPQAYTAVSLEDFAPGVVPIVGEELRLTRFWERRS